MKQGIHPEYHQVVLLFNLYHLFDLFTLFHLFPYNTDWHDSKNGVFWLKFVANPFSRQVGQIRLADPIWAK